jgi:hypothetical protein
MKHSAVDRRIAVKKTVGTSKEFVRAMSPYERVNRQLSMGMWALGVWLALVSLFFLKQTIDYVGLIARLAEWQFLFFDRYWPTLTFLALTLLCSSPLILALWLIRARQRRDEKLGPARIDDGRILSGRLMRLQSFFMGIAVGSVTAAILSLFLMLQLPSDEGAPRSIVLGSPDAMAPGEGPAILTGSVDVSETAQFNENLILVKRTLYFAPIRSGPDDKSPLRYFVEVRRNDVRGDYNKINFPKGRDLVRLWRYEVPGLSFTPYQSGVLRRRGLPGEIANGYRYAGYQVDPDNYVLFRSKERLTWRYLVIAAEFLLTAIIAGVMTGIMWRRRRKLSQTVKKSRISSKAAAEAA